MAVDFQRPVVLVDADIEEERRIAAPHDAAGGLLDRVGQVLAALPVAHADGEILRAPEVGAPGFEAMVRRMPGLAEVEVGRPFGQLIAVEQDPDVVPVAPPIAWRAADQPVLAALAIFPEIGERAVGLGHARIVFLDAPAHLGDQRLLQRLGRPENRLGVTVLRLQVRPDVGIEPRRVAQDLLPVCVLQPGIVVGERDAVERALKRTPARDGRLLAGTLRRNCRVPCHWLCRSPCPWRARRPVPAWRPPSSAWRAGACASRRPWCPTSRRGCGRPSRCRNV